MRVDGHGQIAGQRGHFDGQHSFGNKFAGSGANESHAQHALGLRVNDQFGHAFGTVERDGAPRCTPGKFRYFDLPIFFFSLGLGEAAPCNFGIGEHDCRNRRGFEGDLVSSDGFDGDTSLVRSLVRQHGLTNHVADRVDEGIGGLKLLVHFDKATRVDLHLRFVESGDLGVRLPSY